jgi:ABC-type spermidine/putrescine transport system permease subunit II
MVCIGFVLPLTWSQLVALVGAIGCTVLGILLVFWMTRGGDSDQDRKE